MIPDVTSTLARPESDGPQTLSIRWFCDNCDGSATSPSPINRGYLRALRTSIHNRTPTYHMAPSASSNMPTVNQPRLGMPRMIWPP